MVQTQIEITEVRGGTDSDSTDPVSGALDVPVAGSRFDGHFLRISGWALVSGGAPREIRVIDTGALAGSGDDRILATTRADRERTDVAQQFSDVANAGRCGFETSLSLVGLPARFEFAVLAIGEQGKGELARVIGSRAPLRTRSDPAFDPILLNVSGRSGSRWLLQLLGAHPEIVTYRPFEYEPRVASYWMDVFRTIATPPSLSQQVMPEFEEAIWWVGRRRTLPPLQLADDPEIQEWLSGGLLENLATFFQSRIDEFYRRAVASRGAGSPRYFAERAHNRRVTNVIREVYGNVREVFLARDFRDVLCSRLAFDRKTGMTQFGRAPDESDEEYVRGAMRRELIAFADAVESAAGPAVLVRYEDLVRRTEESLQRLFDGLGVAAGDEAVRDVLDAVDEQSSSTQRSHGTSADALTSIGRWKRELDPALARACNESFGELLRKLGYEAG